LDVNCLIIASGLLRQACQEYSWPGDIARLAAIQATATIEITTNTAQPGFRLARFIEAGEDDLQHALSHIAMALGHGQYRTLQEIEQLIIAEGGNRQLGRQLPSRRSVTSITPCSSGKRW
jgi:hypothetical protein